MRILFVVEHFYPYVGGAEELFLNLTVSLVQAGYDVNVVTTLYDKSLLKNEEYKGVKISRVNCHNRFLFTVMSLPEIFRIAKKADCIQTTSYNSAVPSFIAGLFLKKRVIITFHEVWDKLWFQLPFTSSFKLTGFYLYEKFILMLPFHKYIAVSESTRNALIKYGIPRNKIVKIYNGLDYKLLSTYTHHPPENFTYCFFGRLGISKGIDLLLLATKSFLSKYPESAFKFIIPTYPERLFKKVMRFVRYHQLENKIVIMHNLSKESLLHEVSSSSCVIIPSYSEGFCYVAAESVGIGVPVISSGKGSLSEVVNGKHIILESLSSEAIFKALERAKNNDWDYSTPHHFNLFESIENYKLLYQSMNTKNSQ